MSIFYLISFRDFWFTGGKLVIWNIESRCSRAVCVSFGRYWVQRTLEGKSIQKGLLVGGCTWAGEYWSSQGCVGFWAIKSKALRKLKKQRHCCIVLGNPKMEAAKLKEKVVFVLVVACMSCPHTDITSTWREDTSASSPGCLLVTLPFQNKGPQYIWSICCC